MAEHHPQYIPERILQVAVSKQVSVKLGSIGQEFGELMKGMTIDDSLEAKLMLIEMIRTGCGEFCEKMKRRIEASAREGFADHDAFQSE